MSSILPVHSEHSDMAYKNPRAAREYRPQCNESLHGMRENGELRLTITRDDHSKAFTTRDWLEAYRWLGQDEAAWRLLCLLGCPTCVPPKGAMPL